MGEGSDDSIPGEDGVGVAPMKTVVASMRGGVSGGVGAEEAVGGESQRLRERVVEMNGRDLIFIYGP